MLRNSRVIRTFLVLMLIVVTLIGKPVFAEGETVVRVDPSPQLAKVNDSVNLSIEVDNIVNLTALELHLSFNPSVLEVVQVTNGGFVAADFTAQNTFNNTTGTIDYAIAQFSQSPAQGSGSLLNIVFRAKANGNATVALRATQAVPSGLLLSNQNGMAIQATWENGSVTVGDLTTTPSPVIPTVTKTATPTSIVATQTVTSTGTSIAQTATPTMTMTSIVQTATPTTTPMMIIPSIQTTTPTTASIITTVTQTATPTTPDSTPIDLKTTIPLGSTLGTHIVRFWESLYCIGRAYRVSPWAIADANGLWWPYIIFPSQSLLIPNVSWSPIPVGPICPAQFSTSITILSPTAIPTVTSTTASVVTPGVATAVSVTATVTPVHPTAIPATAVSASGCHAYYTVRPKDTLYHIATLYGIHYSEIARANQIADATLIYSGQQLCIP